jgi:hypothetical protein
MYTHAQDVANTIWAYATMGLLPHDDLVAGLKGRTLAVVRDFNGQDVANTFWAFAKLGVYPGEQLLDALSDQALQTVQYLNSQVCCVCFFLVCICMCECLSENALSE